MHKVVKAELFKLKRNKAYWFILLLSFGIYLALGLMTDEKSAFKMRLLPQQALYLCLVRLLPSV